MFGSWYHLSEFKKEMRTSAVISEEISGKKCPPGIALV